MANIEERLRNIKPELERFLSYKFPVMDEAADEIERLRSLAKDDPELDATDFAHPAWWRGHDHTVNVFCKRVEDIIDGKDDGRGANYMIWGRLRQKLLSMARRVLQLKAPFGYGDRVVLNGYYTPWGVPGESFRDALGDEGTVRAIFTRITGDLVVIVEDDNGLLFIADPGSLTAPKE